MILSALVASFNHDPVHQWTELRRLSRRQSTNITLYLGAWHRIDYAFSYVEAEVESPGSGSDGLDLDTAAASELDQCNTVVFHADQTTAQDDQYNPNPFTPAALAKLWHFHGHPYPVAAIRVGLGVMNGGLDGGFILSVANLDGLKVDSDDGSEIRFRFRSTFTRLMRERSWLNEITSSMVTKTLLIRLANRPSLQVKLNTMNPLDLLKELVMHIQIPRYVELAKRIALWRDPTGNTPALFHESTNEIHHQYETPYLIFSNDESWSEDSSSEASTEAGDSGQPVSGSSAQEADGEGDGDDVPDSDDDEDEDEDGDEDEDESSSSSEDNDNGGLGVDDDEDDDALNFDDDDDDLDAAALREPSPVYHNAEAHLGRMCCHEYHDDRQCCCSRGRQAFCRARYPPDMFLLADRDESMVPLLPIFQDWLRVRERDPHQDSGEAMDLLHRIYHLAGHEYQYRTERQHDAAECRFLSNWFNPQH
ncbi:hypothetical protein B0T26DRAFT_807897 [Lasiosphaeria miniovina]|uniref:Uncharacterized protein n=1 Tax=Lasiosphaeria miniovina TaxID=1954250 RepID=A0AA39ZR91_9PEZI|nr:uncharacterized protein B0T26DRAFT_807897 [Lasiosphaeria miniovina]KAK0702103.1 hypothetical protein B0T26DRAFT_807897 [Lasiosphaeria miniovina]